MKRKGFTLIEVLVTIAIIALIAALLFPIFARKRVPGGPQCMSNLKQISLGLLQYIQDNNGKFPPVASSGATYGWVESIFDYTKTNAIFRCPAAKHTQRGGNPNQRGFTDYWYNRNMARKDEIKITNSDSLIMLGDGNDGEDNSDTCYSLNALPAKWINDQNSPLYRHDGAANYAFADGHVKRLKPQEILSSPESYTFQVSYLHLK